MHDRSGRVVALALSLILCGLAPAATLAQDEARRPPVSAEEVRLSYAPIVKRAAPAVVNVYAQRVTRQQPFFSDPFFQQFFGGDLPMRERVQQSLGSGVIVDPSGIVITNVHVIADADQIKVALSDGTELPAEVVLKDERSDLAALRIGDGKGDFPVVELAESDDLQVGDLVLAIGNPFGVGQTVTSGIISGLARTHVGQSDSQFFIQTDAAINPGNSGGALVDMNGRLVGINTAIFSRSGGSDGIGFAIPSDMVRVVVQSALNGAVVRRPWIGATLDALTPQLAAGLGVERTRGALVSNVVDDSPAAKAGLVPGDLITAVDGVAVEDPSAFNYRLITKGIGQEATFTVLRDGAERQVEVALIAAPETVGRNEVELRGRSPLAGAKVANLSPAVAEELGYTGEPSGVIITEIASGSPAQQVGFRRGDVLLGINGARVESTEDLAGLTSQRARAWRIELERDGRLIRTILGG